jgi:hypothetical protein
MISLRIHRNTVLLPKTGFLWGRKAQFTGIRFGHATLQTIYINHNNKQIDKHETKKPNPPTQKNIFTTTYNFTYPYGNSEILCTLTTIRIPMAFQRLIAE